MAGQTVYIVTKGQYSDYQIVAAFTDREAAKACANLQTGKYNKARVELHRLDPPPDQADKGRAVWTVEMGTAGDSNVEQCWWNEIDRKPDKRGKGYWVFYIEANDEKHAVKIANERRVQMIAAGEW